jgi:hypothetical protein
MAGVLRQIRRFAGIALHAVKLHAILPLAPLDVASAIRPYRIPVLRLRERGVFDRRGRIVEHGREADCGSRKSEFGGSPRLTGGFGWRPIAVEPRR